MTTILGIESTAHTFGIGIVRDGKVLANCRDAYATESGGIIPMAAAKHHLKVSERVYADALKEAGISEDKLDVIAFSQGPGLAPCLIQGINFAKKVSKKLGKPLVPVNHCVAHLEVGRLTGARDPVMLYTSGANTQVIAYSSGCFRVFGETLDMGVGNFIDNFARHTGIGFPGGPEIERLAGKGKKYIELPYSVKGMDVSLSGILTNLKQKFDGIKNLRLLSDHEIDGSEIVFGQVSTSGKKVKHKSESGVSSSFWESGRSEANYTLEDLAFSLQETVFTMLVETAERAMAHTGKKELLLGGGVACNLRLQEMCRIMCEERGAKFFCPPRDLLVDNGAMIAFLGEMIVVGYSVRSPVCQIQKMDELDIKPRQRADDVDVCWR